MPSLEVFFSGRKGFIARVQERLRAKGTNFLYLTATPSLRDQVKREIWADPRLEATSTLPVFTLGELIGRWGAGRKEKEGRPPATETFLSRLGQTLLVREILATDKTLEEFVPVREFPGVAAAVVDAIRELKQALVTPEGFNKALAALGGWDGGGKVEAGRGTGTGGSLPLGRLRELGRIYQIYQEFCAKQHLVDREESGWELLARLGEGWRPPWGEHLFVEGFLDFTPLQAAILRALCPLFESVAFSLPHPQAPALAALRGMARELGLSLREEDGEDGKQRGLHRAAPVTILEAPGRERMVRRVAREIKRLCLSGCPPEAIAVVARQPDLYQGLLQEALTAVGVAGARWEAPLAELPLLKAAGALLTVVSGDWQRLDVLRWLKALGGAAVWPDLLEREAVRRGVRAGEAGWLRLVAELRREAELAAAEALPMAAVLPVAGKQAEDRPEAAEVCGARGDETEEEGERKITSRWRDFLSPAAWAETCRGLEALFQRAAAFPQESTLDELATALVAVMRIDLPSAPGTALRGGERTQGGSQAGGIQTQVDRLYGLRELTGLLGSLQGAFRQLGWQERKLTRTEFARLFQELLQGRRWTDPRRLPPAGKGVRLYSPSEIRGLSFPYVFVLGLNEGEFPYSFPEEWLLGEGARQALRRQGLALELREERLAREESLFAMVQATARRRLYLATQWVDAQGEPQLPSRFLAGYLRKTQSDAGAQKGGGGAEERGAHEAVTGTVEWEREELGALLPAEPTAAVTATEFLQWRVAQQHRLPLSSRFWGGGQPFSVPQGPPGSGQNESMGWLRHLARMLAVIRARNSRVFTPWDGNLALPEIQAALGRTYSDGVTLSTSRMDTYGKCPFRYFCQYVLGLQEPEELTVELSPMERGSLAHRILYLFFDRYRGQALQAARREEYRRELEEIMREVWAWQREGKAGGERGGEGEADRTQAFLLAAAEARMRRELLRLLDLEIKRSEVTGGALRPTFLEAAFGWQGGGREGDEQDPRSTVRRLRLTLGGEELYFQGRIDRIDTGEAGFVVFDYKTGGTPEYEEISGGQSFQIPLYLWAASAFFCDAELSPIGGGFYSLRSGKYSAGIWQRERVGVVNLSPGSGRKGFLTTEEWEEVLKRLHATLFAYRRAWRAGDFRLLPRTCSYCPYRYLCRYERWRIARKNENDPSLPGDAGATSPVQRLASELGEG